ncbi:MAG: 2-hydroxychromene-2-carboxylate isomerase [Alphaproteobacteria bacterium]|nr:2-hydroxychromene-2-carboxylate isomerase [Alphaproteobacteria bacterium]
MADEQAESKGGPISFYFDFSSPYGFIASEVIDQLGAGHKREVVWRPFLLGVVFKVTGSQPLTETPLKSTYAKLDFARSARLLKIPFKLPAKFPFSGVSASRAFYWLDGRDPALARSAAQALYRQAFQKGEAIDNPSAVAAALAPLLDPLGIQAEELQTALNDPAVKDRLREEVESAVSRGVFGSPYFIVDGEPFWGTDRLGQLQHWIETGGW